MTTRWSSLSRPAALLMAFAILLSCDSDDSSFGPRDEDAFVSSVTGRVVDRRGKPLAGAVATASPGGGSAVTDSDGRFAIGGLVPGSYAVALSRHGYRDTAWADSARPGLSASVDLGVLAMGGRFGVVAGVVLDSSGGAVSGAGVVVQGGAGSVRSGGDGRFRLDGVEVGAIRVVAAAQGKGWGWIDTVLGSEDTLRELRPRLVRRGGTVFGRVTGSDGKAAAGADVSAFGGALRVKTDSVGNFAMEGVPDGVETMLEVAAGTSSVVVTGVRASEGPRTGLGTIQVPASSSGTVAVRNGLAVAWTTDSVAILAADLVSGDSTFRVLRFLWSLDAGKTWDTVSSASYRLRPDEAGWTPGARTVHVKALASDGRVSATGRIVVRVTPPPDWTPPSIRRASPSTDTLFAWADSAVDVSWSVSDDRRLARVLIDSIEMPVVDGLASRTLILPVGRSAVRVVAIDSAGNVAVDSLVLERARRPDLEPPAISWTGPGRDTAFAWGDSVARISWTVSDSVRLDSVWLDGDPVAPAGFVILFLPVGGTTLRMRARDSAGNTAVDSLVLVRRERPDSTRPTVRRRSPSRDTTCSWRDSALAVSWTVFDDRRLDSVLVDGISVDIVDSVARRTVRLAQGATTVVRIRVRDSSGNVVVDSLRISRQAVPDTIPPLIVRRVPSGDTAVAWEDSLFRAGWTVSDNMRVDTVWIQGVATPLDTGAWRTVALAVGANTLRIRVRDAAGNVSLDSLVATRLPRTSKSDSVLGLLRTATGRLSPSFHPDTLAYRDTVDISATELLVQAVPLDASATVAIGGVAGRSRRVPLGAQGSVTTVRVVVRAADGDSLAYVLRVARPGDSTWGVAVLQGLSYGVLLDSRDGSEYRTVRIGAQNWMAENLAVAVDSSWCPASSSDTCAKYGRLYAWSAAMSGSDSSAEAPSGVRGACPSGWHVPSDSEWSILVAAVERDARVGAGAGGTALKARRGWPDTAGGSDLFGFRALPSGYRFVGGDGPTGLYAHFWSSTSGDPSSAFLRSVYHVYPRIYRGSGDRRSGYAVRCLEDPPDTSTALRSLSVSRGRLSPSFDPERAVHDDTVGTMVESLTVAAAAASRAATVSIENGGVANLATDSVISVVVRNGARSRAYVVRIFHDPDSTHGIPWRSGIGFGTLRDGRDGKEYRTVEIGGRRWMAENLDHAVEGSSCYGNDPDSCDRNGRLYRWSTAMGLDVAYDSRVWTGADSTRQGICPSGWRLPAASEWSALATAAASDPRVGSGKAGRALRSAAGWSEGSGGDLFGFRGLASGWRSQGTDYNSGTVARFWTATGYSAYSAWSRALTGSSDDVGLYTGDKSQSYSVRCIETIPDTSTMLRSLSVSNGALVPAFSMDRVLYADTVSTAVESLLVSAVAVSPRAVVTVEGSGTIDLSRDSVVAVRVVNGANSRIYTVHVFHRPVDTTWGVPLAAGVSHGVLHDARDGKEYRTVRIGDRTWMAENLAWKADSSWCPAVSDDSCLKYGRLYSWTAAAGIPDSWSSVAWAPADSTTQGACPAGWHLPTQSDWSALRAHVEADSRVGTGNMGAALKATGGWGTGGGGLDAFGFRALPAGYTYGIGSVKPGSNTGFWGVTPSQSTGARVEYLYASSRSIWEYIDSKTYGYSVRCVEDPPDTSTALATLTVSGSGSLAPAFQPDSLSYVDSVAPSVASLDVSATALSGAATVSIDGGGHVDLSTDSVIEIRVANGASSRTYAIRVFHRPPDSLWRVPLNPAIVHGVLRDARDGREYRTVRIGDQHWMAENLALERDSSWCAIGDADSCGKYGRLYTWTAAMGFAAPWDAVDWTDDGSIHRGACPAGWHLPAQDEWRTLFAALGGMGVASDSVGSALRAAAGWVSPGTDRFGFRALPSGYRAYDGSIAGVGTTAPMWASTRQPNPTLGTAAGFQGSGNLLGALPVGYAAAVRCLEDAMDTSTALGSLGVDQGVLSPRFLSTRLVYDDTLDPGIASVTLSPKPLAPRAVATVVGGATLDLATDSVATVEVLNGASKRVYAVRFHHRAVADTTFGIPWKTGIAYGVLRDARDNKSYRTVRVGGRNWMAENLDHAADSSSCVAGSADSCAKYGRLYTWPAAMGFEGGAYATVQWNGRLPQRGVCPSGWHLPDDAEMRTLRDSVRAAFRTIGGGEMPALASTAGWDGSMTGYDHVGFRLLPAGTVSVKAFGGGPGWFGGMWSATGAAATARRWGGTGDRDTLVVLDVEKVDRNSVRCVEDLPDTSTALVSLGLSRGTLSPAFSPDILSYVDTVESTDSVISVSARAASAAATVAADSGVALATDSVVEAVVSNGGTSRTYSVRVVRREPRPDTTFGIPWAAGASYGVLRDPRDGQSYRTVVVGGHRWMAENLNYRVDSSWCVSGNSDSCAKYGRAYAWSGAMDLDGSVDTLLWLGNPVRHQGACPAGWHVPTNVEWAGLLDSAASRAGIPADSAARVLRAPAGWTQPPTGTDAYGFRILGTGYRQGDGSFTTPGQIAGFWTSTQISYAGSIAVFRLVYSDHARIYDIWAGKNYGWPLRCVEDD